MNIRVMSYNIHKGFDTWGSRLVLHDIRNGIRDVGADIVLLQEVVGENKKWKIEVENYPSESQFEYLADTLWPHYSYGKNAIFTYRDHGNAILSKFPIVFEENIDISTNSLEQRGLLHAEIEIPNKGKKIHLFNVHLDLLHRGRELQLKKLISRFQSHIPMESPFVLAGDFNDWPQRVTRYLNQTLHLRECHKDMHGTYASSYPSRFPLLKLDRVYYHNLHLVSAMVLKGKPWSYLSDHLPLIAEFKV
jgi:endonuclease/exonuclease/phosphatase family metal-dependent hydrolase